MILHNRQIMRHTSFNRTVFKVSTLIYIFTEYTIGYNYTYRYLVGREEGGELLCFHLIQGDLRGIMSPTE
jgi:hypothetical protein